jgi:hypothetical protein
VTWSVQALGRARRRLLRGRGRVRLPRSRLSPTPGVGRGGACLPRSSPGPRSGEAETVFRGRGRVRPLGSGEAETVFRGRGRVRALGRARRRPSSEAEAVSEPWGRARRNSSSSVEVEPEPWGRARQSFLWRSRLDLAAVSLTLSSGAAVGATQAALFSCQVDQWSGEVTAVTSALSTEEHASG